MGAELSLGKIILGAAAGAVAGDILKPDLPKPVTPKKLVAPTEGSTADIILGTGRKKRADKASVAGIRKKSGSNLGLASKGVL